MNNSNSVLQIPIEDIIPNRFQPRLAFDESSLKELADSIKQHGIIQPLVLRRIADKYEIIAGERRYKAAMMAGLSSVPAIITEMDDNTSAEVAIVENVQRKDLTAIEEARSYKALLDKGYMTQEELAKKMGLSQSAVSNKLRLLSLDEAVQDAILNNKISERHARSLLKITNLDEQKKLLNRIITERLTVRQLEEEIKKMNIVEPNEENTLANETLNNETPVAPQTPADSASEVKTEATPDVTLVSEPKIVIEEPKNSSTPVSSEPQPKKTFSNIFSNPSQIPNKFFNFLEDEAVNMATEDGGNPENGGADEEIELLDIPDNNTNTGTYVNEVINKIKDLNLDSSKVTITESDLASEYEILIKITKD